MTPLERELLQLLAELFARLVEAYGKPDVPLFADLWGRWQAIRLKARGE